NTSPRALYTTFPPSLYRTLKAWGSGDDEICVLCHHHGKHTGGPYMGVKPTGNQLDVLWFSWLKFEGDKIVHIYSISDVLSMLIDLEVIAAPQPVDPYKRCRLQLEMPLHAACDLTGSRSASLSPPGRAGSLQEMAASDFRSRLRKPTGSTFAAGSGQPGHLPGHVCGQLIRKPAML